MCMKHLRVNTVREIIALAERVPVPMSGESGPLLAEDVCLHAEEQIEFVQAINDLSGPERAELIALAWLGRGDHDETADDYPSLVREAQDNIREAAGYLAEKRRL